MRNVSNTTGSISGSETSRKAGSFTDVITGYDDPKELIALANSVSLISIFKHYGVRIDESNIKCTCPFNFHNGGKERTPSFTFYPTTNSFYCFGCKSGRYSVDFVAAMEGISRIKAANKILGQFSSETYSGFVDDKDSFYEKLEIIMDFSNSVLEFRNKFSSEKSFKYIENICEIFDSINSKELLKNNQSLKFTVDQLKAQILGYHE